MNLKKVYKTIKLFLLIFEKQPLNDVTLNEISDKLVVSLGGLHHQLLSNLANRPILQGIGPINQGLNPAFGPANRPPFKPLQTLGQNLFGSTTSSQSSASSSQSTSTNETEDYDEITDDVIQQQLNNRRKRIRFDELQNKVASNNFYDGRTPYYYQYRRDDPVQHRSFSWGE